jgi:acylphosphatase
VERLYANFFAEKDGCLRLSDGEDLMGVVRVQAIVSGRVQGVGYRYFAKHVAEQLGLVGTVRNGHDGHVEVVAEGEESAIDSLMKDLRRGPLHAEVTEVQTAYSDATGNFSSFEAIS